MYQGPINADQHGTGKVTPFHQETLWGPFQGPESNLVQSFSVTMGKLLHKTIKEPNVYCKRPYSSELQLQRINKISRRNIKTNILAHYYKQSKVKVNNRDKCY